MSELPLLCRRAVGLPAPEAPIRVVQLGEGRFLRGFLDVLVQDLANDGFTTRVAMTNLRSEGSVNIAALARQDGLYTVLVHDPEGEPEARVVDVVLPLDIDREWPAVVSLFGSPGVQVLVSNSTEAGLQAPGERVRPQGPARTLVGRVIQLLEARWRAAPDAPLTVLPTELVPRNGDLLARSVADVARSWAVDPDFCAWLECAPRFRNTVVDRIVTAFAPDDLSGRPQLPYIDPFCIRAERYGAWWIEATEDDFASFPLHRLPEVHLVSDVAPYERMKLLLLNGPHLVMAAVGLSSGRDTVDQVMNDPQALNLLESYWSDVRTVVPLPAHEVEQFLAGVRVRFRQAWLHHRLSDIFVRVPEKWRVRVAPAIEALWQRHGAIPEPLAVASAAILRQAGRDDWPTKPGIYERWAKRHLIGDGPEPAWWPHLLPGMRGTLDVP